MKLAVQEVTEFAKFFGVPQALVNQYVIKFVGKDKQGNVVENLYYKLPYYLMKIDPKHGGRGIQSMQFEEELVGDEWRVKVTIYPQITSRIFENLMKITDKTERQQYWDYLTRPIIEKGTASPKSVKMSTMLPYLREIAIKRAVVRALRWMVSSGATAYEELPEVEQTPEEIRQADSMSLNPRIVGHSTAADQETPEPLTTHFDVSGLNWWTKGQNGKNRAWQPEDTFGFANVEVNGEVAQAAKPILEAINSNNGAIIQDGEIFSVERGQLLRRKMEGTL